MRKERQAILHLVAVGRLTGAEAERLLILSNEGRDWGWFVLLAIVFCAVQASSNLWTAPDHLAHELLPELFKALRAAVTALGSLPGGTL